MKSSGNTYAAREAVKACGKSVREREWGAKSEERRVWCERRGSQRCGDVVRAGNEEGYARFRPRRLSEKKERARPPEAEPCKKTP